MKVLCVCGGGEATLNNWGGLIMEYLILLGCSHTVIPQISQFGIGWTWAWVDTGTNLDTNM